MFEFVERPLHRGARHADEQSRAAHQARRAHEREADRHPPEYALRSRRQPDRQTRRHEQADRGVEDDEGRLEQAEPPREPADLVGDERPLFHDLQFRRLVRQFFGLGRQLADAVHYAAEPVRRGEHKCPGRGDEYRRGNHGREHVTSAEAEEVGRGHVVPSGVSVGLPFPSRPATITTLRLHTPESPMRTLALVALLTLPAFAHAQKEAAVKAAAAHAEADWPTALKIWEFAEPGYQEKKSSALLAEVAEKA